MSLELQIQADMKTALKEKKQHQLSTLRTLVAQIKDERIKLRPKREITDEDVLRVVQSAVKKRREAVELYEKGGRPELAQKEREEIAFLQKYLPEQLSEDAIVKVIEEVIAASGASSIKDMGRVMGPVMGRLQGRADGKLVQSLVKERLTKMSS